MKNICLLIVWMLFYNLSLGQTTNIGDRIEVKFPSPPERQKLGNKTLYTFYDSSYAFNVMIADMSSNPNFNVKPGQLPEVYKGFINGALDAATDSKLLEERIIQLGQFEGREMRYTKDFNGVDDMLVTKWILLIDKVLYTFEVWDIGKTDGKLKKEFFESIVVK